LRLNDRKILRTTHCYAPILFIDFGQKSKIIYRFAQLQNTKNENFAKSPKYLAKLNGIEVAKTQKHTPLRFDLVNKKKNVENEL
jgi:hypothetical protein